MNLLDKMILDPEKNRTQYEFQLIEGAREDGEYWGYIKGYIEGYIEVMEEFKVKGRTEVQLEIARNCLRDGQSPETVSKNTGLDLETVLSIQSQYQ